MQGTLFSNFRQFLSAEVYPKGILPPRETTFSQPEISYESTFGQNQSFGENLKQAFSTIMKKNTSFKG